MNEHPTIDSVVSVTARPISSVSLEGGFEIAFPSPRAGRGSPHTSHVDEDAMPATAEKRHRVRVKSNAPRHEDAATTP